MVTWCGLKVHERDARASMSYQLNFAIVDERTVIPIEAAEDQAVYKLLKTVEEEIKPLICKFWIVGNARHRTGLDREAGELMVSPVT